MPELFTTDNCELKWVCVFCARNHVPALANLILVARAAERYSDFLFEGGERHRPKEINQFAIRIDTVAKDRPCGVCRHETVSSSYPSYSPGFPEMFIGENIVCWDCGERHAPELNALRDLAQAAESYTEHVPIERQTKCNGNPEMLAVVDAVGWITCPNCKKRFSSNHKQHYSDGIHKSCGQQIKVIVVTNDNA